MKIVTESPFIWFDDVSVSGCTPPREPAWLVGVWVPGGGLVNGQEGLKMGFSGQHIGLPVLGGGPGTSRVSGFFKGAEAICLNLNFRSNFQRFRPTRNFTTTDPGGHSTFIQVGVCGPDFQSDGACELIMCFWKRGLVNWKFPNLGACELKISKFGGLWAENFQIWGLVN